METTIIKQCMMLGLIVMTCVQPIRGMQMSPDSPEARARITVLEGELKVLREEIKVRQKELYDLKGMTEIDTFREDINKREEAIVELACSLFDIADSESHGRDSPEYIKINEKIKQQQADLVKESSKFKKLLMKKIEVLRIRDGLQNSDLALMTKLRQYVRELWKEEVESLKGQEKIDAVQKAMTERNLEYEKRAGILEKCLDDAEARDDNMLLCKMKIELKEKHIKDRVAVLKKRASSRSSLRLSLKTDKRLNAWLNDRKELEEQLKTLYTVQEEEHDELL